MDKIQSFAEFIAEEHTIHQFDTRVVIDATKKKVSYSPILHHFTTLEGLTAILKSNTLKPGDPYEDGVAAVSLTYNAELPNTLDGLDLTCRISLDKAKLEKKYTLVPYLFIPKKKKFSWECKDEMEEQIREVVQNVRSFILSIEILGNAKQVKALRKLYPKLEIKSINNF